MITLANAQAQVAYGALTELSRLLLPPAGALRIRKTVRDLRAHLDDVEAERQKLLEAHGQHGEDGKLLTGESGAVQFADDEALQAFATAYAELMAATWSTEYPVRASDLGTTATMRAETLVALGELLEEPEEAKTP